MYRWVRQLAAAAAAIVATHATAHSQLELTVPAAGSTVRESPQRVELRFSQRLEPAFSKIRVLSRDGEQVDNRDSTVDRSDARQLGVSMPRLPPGTYRVRWRVLSVDTHVSEGHFTFDVSP